MNPNLELEDRRLVEAARAIGDGPVVMVNLLRFRETPDYPAGFEGARPDSRSGYYQGYVGGFRRAAEELGIAPELVYAGTRLAGLLVGPDDDWDEIVVVRYAGYADLRRILVSDTYVQHAKPHRFAVLADWRFIATKDR
ncbi:hypothetical protein KZ813_06635 [Sphingomonas sp. RHCKR7]|uniref:hypothetical protein n=1 Tax=Sphingomonas folli TaxID=2862497 RepID=UPI001CA51834|nr:hypothetical protein [Sphingomonas folli]MBW6526513.1 hypothetical protein [Sphingomonas folli]